MPTNNKSGNNNKNSNNKNNKTRNTASSNASRFSNSKSSGAVVNIDDIPVGKAATEVAGSSNSSSNNNVFANWDNAFPVTGQTDAKHNFLSTTASVAGSMGGLPNQIIEREAAAAAQ